MTPFSCSVIPSYALRKVEETEGVIRPVNRRRTDNTMAKRKDTKRQPKMYKALHRKLKIE